MALQETVSDKKLTKELVQKAINRLADYKQELVAILLPDIIMGYEFNNTFPDDIDQNGSLYQTHNGIFGCFNISSFGCIKKAVWMYILNSKNKNVVYFMGNHGSIVNLHVEEVETKDWSKEENGPCWFCQKPIKDGELRRMSNEFDCEVHETCLQKAINNPSSDGERQEGEIMANEFGIQKKE